MADVVQHDANGVGEGRHRSRQDADLLGGVRISTFLGIPCYLENLDPQEDGRDGLDHFRATHGIICLDID